MCTKYYIYKLLIHKKTLDVRALIEEILYLEKIEKEIAYCKEIIGHHKNKWGVLSTA